MTDKLTGIHNLRDNVWMSVGEINRACHQFRLGSCFEVSTLITIMSQDFMKLFNVVDIDAMYFHEVSFGKINRLIHKHFSDSCSVWCLSWCLLVSISSFLLAYSGYFLYLLFRTCFLVCSALVANKRTHKVAFTGPYFASFKTRLCSVGATLY